MESGRRQGPCAACKQLKRRCEQDCVFAPYFPASEPNKFASVHKVFGASNMSKVLQGLPENERSNAVNSMVYEANARMRDPVYGCAGTIFSLQQQLSILQTHFSNSQAEAEEMRMRLSIYEGSSGTAVNITGHPGTGTSINSPEMEMDDKATWGSNLKL